VSILSLFRRKRIVEIASEVKEKNISAKGAARNSHEASLRGFTSSPVCEKCLGTAVSLKLSNKVFYWSEYYDFMYSMWTGCSWFFEVPEYLNVTCFSCGHGWGMRCADWTPDA
jgi:hypothetical protein